MHSRKAWTEEESLKLYGVVKDLAKGGKTLRAAMHEAGMHPSHYYRVNKKKKKHPKSVESAQRIELNHVAPTLADFSSEPIRAHVIVVSGSVRSVARLIASLQ